MATILRFRIYILSNEENHYLRLNRVVIENLKYENQESGSLEHKNILVPRLAAILEKKEEKNIACHWVQQDNTEKRAAV